MTQVLDRIERDGGTIELLLTDRGYCRYAEDRWQAELYLDQLLAR